MEILSSPASYILNSNWLLQNSKGVKWTTMENKLFKNALVVFDKDITKRCHDVAAMLPTMRCDKKFDVSNIEERLIWKKLCIFFFFWYEKRNKSEAVGAGGMCQFC